MASRRDELNAYSFARKRTVASFLKPLPNGSMESAPRPVRTILPSIVIGTVIVVGFGACGIIKPAAPQGWDNAGEKVVVGDQSTTRYVVLCSVKVENNNPCPKNKKLLHPVLNLASARLLLDPSKFGVLKVKESVLDGPGAPAHGATIGIPYAPDRLPSKEDAEKKKTWALCEQPGGGEGSKAQKALFVFSERDKNRKKLVDGGKGRLSPRKALFVQDEEGVQYLVDHRGVAHQLDATWAAKQLRRPVSAETKKQLDALLRGILFGQAQPQQVTDEWMKTLIKSPLPIFMPPLENAGLASSATGVSAAYRTTGKVLEADGNYFVVLKDGVAPVSPFVAKLLLEGYVGKAAYQNVDPKPIHVGLASIQADKPQFMGEILGHKVPWPTEQISQANTIEQEGGGNKTICSVYYGGNKQLGGVDTGYRDMSTWAGRDYPAPIVDGSSSAYVSPGSGLLYKQVTGKAKDGPLFLVTDTGLRYSVQVNNDSANSSGNAEQDQNQAQIRLGYGEISSPPLVPKEWSQLLSAGPSLNTDAAKQPQGS